MIILYINILVVLSVLLSSYSTVISIKDSKISSKRKYITLPVKAKKETL